MTGSISELKGRLAGEEGARLLADVYGPEAAESQQGRWSRAMDHFAAEFSDAAARVTLLSAPGRTELAGNHTDHNGGQVLAASVDLDTIGVVAPRDDGRIRLRSRGFPERFEISLSSLGPRPEERESPAALLRGVASALQDAGYRVGGFDAYVESAVPVGSGLSSSASFEILIGIIQNELRNRGEIDAVTLARAGQFAENEYFGKPCGLMDQIACASGGIVRIDFHDETAPELEGVDYDFAGRGYVLAVVNTGSSHADLTEDYAAVPREMRELAQALGEGRARDTSEEQILGSLRALRDEVGDRAILRVLHFHRENRRVNEMVRALQEDDLPRYFAGVRESAGSSWRLLQNYVPTATVREQAIALTAAVAEGRFPDSVLRVHGGGFAGAVQAYVPHSRFAAFSRFMDELYGPESVIPLRIRHPGAGPLA